MLRSRNLQRYLPLSPSVPAGLILIWLLGMIALPIVYWLWGTATMQRVLILSVLLQSVAVFAVLQTSWGWRRTLLTLGTVVIISFIAEYIGSHTGWLFGAYSYTDILQPQLGGVPLLIPLAWFMMLPCAWATVYAYRQRWLLFVLLSAISLTAWDLLLDPQMVQWGLWAWANPEGYFGIPWSNYAGWLLTAAIMTLILRPQKLPTRPLLIIYTLTWFLETFGLALFWGMPGPALVGGLVMGLFVWLGWRAELKK
jgi:putative membrane protein